MVYFVEFYNKGDTMIREDYQILIDQQIGYEIEMRELAFLRHNQTEAAKAERRLTILLLADDALNCYNKPTPKEQ